MDELNESPLVNFLKSNLIIVALGLVGLVLGAFGLYQFFSQGQESGVTIESESIATDVKGAEASSIFVDIEGAVQKPGVYEIGADKRLKDVLSAAGGLAKDADFSFIAKNLNMAAKISDGMKIYVPFEGESSTVLQSSTPLSGVNGVNSEAGSLINVNSASESELDTLPGVGPATAAKIISLRPYPTVDDLLIRKAVGSAVFAKIKDKVIAH